MIKSNMIMLYYKVKDGEEYVFNLIDILGYVDFLYEVCCLLMLCEGVLLLVDVLQGVEVQIVVNLYLVFEYDFEMILVINKIDLLLVDLDCVMEEIDVDFGFDLFELVQVFVKIGEGVEDLFEVIVQKLLLLEGDFEELLQVLFFDVQYDVYCGVVMFCCVKQGCFMFGMWV